MAVALSTDVRNGMIMTETVNVILVRTLQLVSKVPIINSTDRMSFAIEIKFRIHKHWKSHDRRIWKTSCIFTCLQASVHAKKKKKKKGKRTAMGVGAKPILLRTIELQMRTRLT